MSWLFSSFKPHKLQPNLKMAAYRLRLSNDKKTTLIKTEKREIAGFLRQGKDEKARIRVEHIIRQDYTIEAQEILELMCELLQERMRLIVAEETCPSDLVSAICTLIWACDRTDCPELQIVKAQFGKKYGDEFLKMAMANEGGCVNERVSYKLSVQPPPANLVQEYLQQIATDFGVDWDASLSVVDKPYDQPMPAPDGSSVVSGQASNMEAVYAPAGGGVAAVAAAAAAAVVTPAIPPQQQQQQRQLPPGYQVTDPFAPAAVTPAVVPEYFLPPVGAQQQQQQQQLLQQQQQQQLHLQQQQLRQQQLQQQQQQLQQQLQQQQQQQQAQGKSGGVPTATATATTTTAADVLPHLPMAPLNKNNNNDDDDDGDAGGRGSDYDELMARFNALRK